MSHHPKWDPELYGGEHTLVACVDAYDYHVDGPLYTSSAGNIDVFRSGGFISILVLHYGNLNSLSVWHRKTVAAFKDIGVANTHEYVGELQEVGNLLMFMIPMLVMIGDKPRAAELLRATGFGWDDAGFEKFFVGHDAVIGAIYASFATPLALHLRYTRRCCARARTSLRRRRSLLSRLAPAPHPP